MNIPRSTVRRILDAVDLVELVRPYVKSLRRVGTSYSALCVFHRERSPSLSINPKSKLFYCHGCAASGNAIQFLQRVERISFREAVTVLAERAGIPLDAHENRNAVAYTDMIVAECAAWYRAVRNAYARRHTRQIDRRNAWWNLPCDSAEDDFVRMSCYVRYARSEQRWNRIIARLDAKDPRALMERYLTIRANRPRVVLEYREERDLDKAIAQVCARAAAVVGELSEDRFQGLVGVMAVGAPTQPGTDHPPL